jgi:glycine/D-amino acid oxidase-like deaminating enzyme
MTGSASTDRYRSRSLWLDGLPESLSPRDALNTNTAVDVAIIGGGFTGLWTAYSLLINHPEMRVAIIEKEIVGFGASGRNGGWASALFAGSREAMAKAHGVEGVLRMHQAMLESIDDIERTCRVEGIDASFLRGGTLTVARSPSQDARTISSVEDDRFWGLGEQHSRLLTKVQCDEMIRVAGTREGAFTPNCARINPAFLARGLAIAVERLGGKIFEQTNALSLSPGVVITSGGKITAETIVIATEAWSSQIPERKRSLIPIYSLMIATEPLSIDFWDEIGWRNGETLTDARRMIIYAQRTADDRIAFGGRGAPYHFGSRIRDSYDSDSKTFGLLQKALIEMFPSASRAVITHRWGGPLGAPRDWESSVGITADRRLAWAGGYIGDGVTTSNLAGRTLSHLITGTNSPITDLPWVGHRSKKWEVEPFRWLGIRSMGALTRSIDSSETRTQRPARMRNRILDSFTGH